LDLRDAESGRLAREVPGIYPHESDIRINVGRAFAFSADGKLLVVTSDPEPGKPATVYATETWQEVRRLAYDDSIFEEVAVGRDGRVAFNDGGADIVVFDLASGALERVIKAYDRGIMTCIAISPDGKFIVSGAFSPNEWELEPDPLRIWRVEDGVKVRSYAADLQWSIFNSLWVIEAVAWSPDGNEIAWASSDGAVYLWHIHASEEPTKLIEFSRQSFALAFSPDGRHLAIGAHHQVLMMKLER